LVGRGDDLKILYVKDCTKIIEFNLKTKQTRQVGQTKDAVLAMYAQTSKLREVDLDSNEEEKIDLEGQVDSTYIVVAIDDSESVSVFDSPSDLKAVGLLRASSKIKSLEGFPIKLKQKDLFGLGYPYFVSFYAGNLAFSSDYGIFVVKF
jgi:hypothetical protein